VKSLSKNRALAMLIMIVHGRTSRITLMSVPKVRGIAGALLCQATRPSSPGCSCSWRVSGLNDKNAAVTGIYSVNDVMYIAYHFKSSYYVCVIPRKPLIIWLCITVQVSFQHDVNAHSGSLQSHAGNFFVLAQQVRQGAH
jgi:hypothetical protein